MKVYKVQSVQRGTGNIALLAAAPLRQDDGLQFRPGQYVTVSFRRGARFSPVRCFSIVSSPLQDDVLQLAMRVQGPFTKAINRLQPGDELRIQGPYGEFTIDERYDSKLVFIAGGIGVTPFISMLRYAAQVRLSLPITLLYSVRSRRDMAFYDELVRLQRGNPLLKVVIFAPDANGGDTAIQEVSGRIDVPWLQTITNTDFAGSTYFVCGPKGFMSSITKQLQQNGVPEERILTESFAQATTSTWGGMSIQRLTYTVTAAALLLGTGAFLTRDLIGGLVSSMAKTNVTAQPATQTDNSTSSSIQSQQYQAPVSSVS